MKNIYDIIDNFFIDEVNNFVFFLFLKLGKWVVLYKYIVEDFGNC